MFDDDDDVAPEPQPGEPADIAPDTCIQFQGQPVWTRWHYDAESKRLPGVVVCCHAFAPCDWHREIARYARRLTRLPMEVALNQ